MKSCSFHEFSVSFLFSSFHDFTFLLSSRLVLNEEMDKSALKFSRHFEASVLINRLNLGFGAEAGLIWAE